MLPVPGLASLIRTWAADANGKMAGGAKSIPQQRERRLLRAFKGPKLVELVGRIEAATRTLEECYQRQSSFSRTEAEEGEKAEKTIAQGEPELRLKNVIASVGGGNRRKGTKPVATKAFTPSPSKYFAMAIKMVRASTNIKTTMVPARFVVGLLTPFRRLLGLLKAALMSPELAEAIRLIQSGYCVRKCQTDKLIKREKEQEKNKKAAN